MFVNTVSLFMATADACHETSNTAAIGRSGREGNFYTSHTPKSALPLVAIMFANIVSLFMVSVAGFMVEERAATKYVRNLYRLSLFTMNRLTFAC